MTSIDAIEIRHYDRVQLHESKRLSPLDLSLGFQDEFQQPPPLFPLLPSFNSNPLPHSSHTGRIAPIYEDRQHKTNVPLTVPVRNPFIFTTAPLVTSYVIIAYFR